MGIERRWDRSSLLLGSGGPYSVRPGAQSLARRLGRAPLTIAAARSQQGDGRRRSAADSGPDPELSECATVRGRPGDSLIRSCMADLTLVAHVDVGAECPRAGLHSVDGAGRGWTGLWMVGSMASTHFDAHYTQDETAQHCCAVVGNR